MRIQILPLPSVVKGDDIEEPFALVLDECPVTGVSEGAVALWKDFALQCGARAAIATNETVEIVDRYAAPEPAAMTFTLDAAAIKEPDVEKIAEQLKEQIERQIEHLRDKGQWNV